jgi:5-methylcytosine-specific restriction protein B
LEAQWEKLLEKRGGRRTPLLINRTIAASTLDVSSTVNIGDFENVFWWLIYEGLIPAYDGDQQDWYSKNVHLMGHLHDQFAEQLALPEDAPDHTSKTLLSIFVWELSQNIANPFSLRKQIVKYGAPGTGKTYQAKESTSLLFAIWQEKYGHFFPEVSHASNIEVVQFHPSYGYEDFLEGLRPQAAEGGDWQLKLQNGIFKEFCRRAGKWEVDVHQIPDHGPKMAQNWEELKVKDIRPFLGQQLSGESWQGFEDLEGEVKLVDLIPPYFFIIDEINRAELSRVLGELMMCLEYRGVKGAITTQYAALNSAENGMLKTTVGARFFIPHNVYLIGTMNTIDRSVESFDLALRRRFRWEPVDPDPQIARYYLKSLKGKNWDELADDLVKLNKKIRENELLGADYQIGHAYLMNLRYRDSLSLKEVREKIWEDSIAPLLEEYLRGTGRAEELIPEFIKAFGL